MKASTAVIGVPATLSIAILVPLLVGSGAGSSSTAGTAPSPTSSAMTIQLVGDLGGEAAAIVAVEAPGPAPTDAVELVDDGGVIRGSVAPADPAACEDVVHRFAAPGGELWCLRVSHAQSGRTLTAKVSGAEPTDGTAAHALALTVKVKDPFWWWPLVTVLLGFATALFLVFVPPRLKRSVLRARLEDAVDADERRSIPIRGLRTWAAARLRAGAKVGDLLDEVDGLAIRAPGDAASARQALRDALAKSPPLPAGSPVREQAAAEAASTTLAIHDFRDDEGEDATHPATKAVADVGALRELVVIEARLREDLGAAEPGDDRDRAERLLDEARKRIAEADDADAIALAGTRLEDARSAVYQLDRRLTVHADLANFDATAIDEAVAGWMAWGAPVGAVDEPVATPVSTGSSLGGSTGLNLVATIAFGLLAGLLAVVAVVAAGYATNATFGLCTDYLTLYLAAVGSTTAATAFGVLAWWSRFQDDE